MCNRFLGLAFLVIVAVTTNVYGGDCYELDVYAEGFNTCRTAAGGANAPPSFGCNESDPCNQSGGLECEEYTRIIVYDQTWDVPRSLLTGDGSEDEGYNWEGSFEWPCIKFTDCAGCIMQAGNLVCTAGTSESIELSVWQDIMSACP